MTDPNPEPEPQLAKVHVSFRGDAGVGGESLWARAIPDEPDHYIMENIPFFAHGLNLGDVVRCVDSGDHPREIVEVVRPSGNSTFRLAFIREAKDEIVREALQQIEDCGARIECAARGVYAISIDEDGHDPVLAFMIVFEDRGWALYETCDEPAEGSFDAPLED